MRAAGKQIAARIPARSCPPARLETFPTRVGPREQPRSPARAKKANMAVPPFILAEARLNVPGQSMPTEKPQRAQPARPAGGQLQKAIKR